MSGPRPSPASFTPLQLLISEATLESAFCNHTQSDFTAKDAFQRIIVDHIDAWSVFPLFVPILLLI